MKWNKPPVGWHKLNTDGASFGNLGNACRGGIIRDSKRKWVRGFLRSIGYATSIVAEVWALRDGLKLAFSIEIQNLIVELDAKVIVELFKSNNCTNRIFSPIIDDCRSLLDRFHQVCIEHVYWEGNKGTDALARRGAIMSESFAIFTFPLSTDILSIVNMDASDMNYVRLMNADLALVARQ